ncbi:MAG: response regulator [Candidatus Omnitrophota bacterium]
MSKKVLIIDDVEGVRESLKLILSDYYNLIITEDAGQGLECITNDKEIGLVLLDIKMPGNNGLEVLQKIKNISPELPVIIVTGYKSVETATEAVRLGASGYIVKPFKAEEILDVVKKKMK